MTATTEITPTAAGSGRSATASFARKERTAAEVDPGRVGRIATDALAALHDVIRRHQVSYAEYDSLKTGLIGLGEDGEWPLFLDVFVEPVIEEVANADRRGAVGTIEGPYYIPGAPESASETTLPMRPGEPGTPLLFRGTVTDLDGSPVSGALVELWYADAEGYYSQFAPGIPEWNLRGAIRTGADGRYTFHTREPAPYRIPTDGSTGAFIDAAGWHAWRPAHVHLKLSAPGRRPVTTQLYFDGGDFVATDVAQAVKPELILRLKPAASGAGNEVIHDVPLDPAS